MVLSKIKKRLSKDIFIEENVPEEEFVEVGIAESPRPGKIGIVIEKLNDFSDTDRILKSVRNGSLVFLKIKGLREKDLGELKRAVEKLKRTVLAQNGDIVGVEQEWLILAPEHAKVLR
ncbi:MAG: cell division protein SepF [Candidatus Aenigmarchaeota archaeon]|nr:cell division protein SepF [Candidatus Aenigmarchaeota archaeon]